MKTYSKLLLAFLLLVLVVPQVGADEHEDEWQILTDETKRLAKKGDYDRAVVVAKKALEVATENVSPNHPDVAQSLNNLATLYQAQGKYAKAEPLFKRSLAIWEKALGPEQSRLDLRYPRQVRRGGTAL